MLPPADPPAALPLPAGCARDAAALPGGLPLRTTCTLLQEEEEGEEEEEREWERDGGERVGEEESGRGMGERSRGGEGWWRASGRGGEEEKREPGTSQPCLCDPVEDTTLSAVTCTDVFKGLFGRGYDVTVHF